MNRQDQSTHTWKKNILNLASDEASNAQAGCKQHGRRGARKVKGKPPPSSLPPPIPPSPLSPPPLPERGKVGNASRHAPLPPFQTSFETPLLLSVSQRPPPPTPPPPSAPFSRRPPSPKKLARKGHIRMAYIFPPPRFIRRLDYACASSPAPW